MKGSPLPLVFPPNGQGRKDIDGQMSIEAPISAIFNNSLLP